MRHALILLAGAWVAPAFAAGPTVLQYLPNYSCSRLNVTQHQAMDPHGGGVVIRTQPSPGAPVGTTAPSILFVKQPRHQVGQYVEVLQINNQPGWIDASYVGPSSGAGQCRPALMSNGRIGAAP